jgi:hypothetical protein
VFVCAASLTLAACGNRAPASAELGDASAPTPTSAGFAVGAAAGQGGVEAERAHRVIEALRARPVFASNLARDARDARDAKDAQLRDVGGGFARAARSPAAGLALDVRLPARADGAVRVRAVGSPLGLEVAPAGLGAAAGVVDGSAIVYVDAAASTDLVLAITEGGYEELRVLRDARAAAPLRWQVKLDAGLSLRARQGRLEAFDAVGVVRVQTAPMFAVDARGVRRELDVRLEASGEGEAARGAQTAIATLDRAGLAYPITVDPLWTSEPSMSTVRDVPSLAPLGDGTLLIVAGQAPFVDVYNPTAHTITQVGQLPIVSGMTMLAWGGAKAAPLPSGDALVVGTNGSARYAFATKTWTVLAGETALCSGCQLAPLADGRVLKVPGASAIVELFTPTTNKWSVVAALPVATTTPAVARLKDGRIFALDQASGNGCYLYNPTTNAWSVLPLVPTKNSGSQIVGLNDGRLLLAAGWYGAGSLPDSAMVYDPAKNVWSNTLAMTRVRATPGLALLPGGRVLAAGGETGGAFDYQAEIFDPVAMQWSVVEAMPQPRSRMPALTLADGSVFVAGGFGTSGPMSTTLRYTGTAVGTSCAYPAYPQACATGNCVDGVCCSAASCPRGTCNAPSAIRAAGVCASVDGEACTKDVECVSNHCADGFCCNTACAGQCESCGLPSQRGVCTAVVGAPVGKPACGGAGAGTTCGATCDGVTRTSCSFPAKGKLACGTDACAAGVETVSATCDGAGACPVTTNPCGAYGCGKTACKRSCQADADCADASYYCAGDACLPKAGKGAACTSAAMCPSGMSCTDGVCCGVASCGAGSSCAAGPVKGDCAKLSGTACGADAECASRHCADGVCCDRACGGQCEACDLPGTGGTCTPVAGAPRNARPACDDGGGDRCKARTCDGAKDTTQCVGYANGATVVCESAVCDGASLVPVRTCDGAGACLPAVKASCGKYACDLGSVSCRASCTANEHCAPGFSCVAGVCSETARCTDDRTASTATDGARKDCAPYVCGTAGTCLAQCATSLDCAAGTACSATGVCEVPQAPSGSSGGCSAAPGGAGGAGDRGAAVAGLALIGALVGARRRRRPRRVA